MLWMILKKRLIYQLGNVVFLGMIQKGRDNFLPLFCFGLVGLFKRCLCYDEFRFYPKNFLKNPVMPPSFELSGVAA